MNTAAHWTDVPAPALFTGDRDRHRMADLDRLAAAIVLASGPQEPETPPGLLIARLNGALTAIAALLWLGNLYHLCALVAR